MALTLFEPGAPLAIRHTLTPVSLQLPSDLTAPQWQQVGAALQRVDEARQWWIGDWWNAGVKWGEGQRVCEEIGLNYQTARIVGSVADRIKLFRRRNNLPFAHHQEVCVLTEAEVQDRFLLWCEEPIEATGKPRSVRELREAIKSYLDSQGWTDFERERRRWVEQLGYPTLANQTLDTHLLQWAKMNGRHVYIGRGSKWGNPFELGKDGPRHYVIESYCFHYLPRKQSLIDALPELEGKVLECYCVPERCHGEVLIETLKREAWELLDGFLQQKGEV
jgi:Domain of unknown function (DUF4326)